MILTMVWLLPYILLRAGRPDRVRENMDYESCRDKGMVGDSTNCSVYATQLNQFGVRADGLKPPWNEAAMSLSKIRLRCP